MAAPAFTQELQDVTTTEGGTATFHAVVAGKPRPDVRWFRGSDDVTSSHNYEVNVDEKGRASLRIPEVFDEDAAEFTCLATNPHGSAQSRAELILTDTFVDNANDTATARNIQKQKRQAPVNNSTYNLQDEEQRELRAGDLDEVIYNLGAAKCEKMPAHDWSRAAHQLNHDHGSMSENHLALRENNSSSHNDAIIMFSSFHPATVDHGAIASRSPTSSPMMTVFKTNSQLSVAKKNFAVFPPFIKSKSSELKVKEGELSLLTCDVTGNPIPSITWYREGARIDNSHDFETSFTGKISTLFIRDTLTDDAGTYTCTASNEAGSATCTFQLKVESVPVDSRKSKPDQLQSASEIDYDGTEAELDFISGISEAEATDNEMFKPATQRVSSANNSAIPAVEPNALNSLASVSPPKFEKFPPSRVKLVEGGSIRLDCVISGNPAPSVAWSRNEMMLKSGYRYKVIEDRGKNMYSLLIAMLFPDDVGEYKVTATNQFGFITGSVFLISEDQYSFVDGSMQRETPSDFLSQNGASNFHANRFASSSRATGSLSASPSVVHGGGSSRSLYRSATTTPLRQDEDVVPESEKYFKPRFLIIPGSRECKEGETTRIDCKATGRPNPDIIFLRSDSVIAGSRHRVVVKENGIHSLIISPVQPEDSGEYKIVAESVAGREECSVQLTVVAGEDEEPPRIVEKPHSLSAREGELVRLEVFAVGRPTPDIGWLKDNILLKPDKHPDVRIEGVDGHSLLTIGSANKTMHDAWFTATAVNKVGRDLTRCKVSVFKSNDSPAIEQKSYVPKTKKATTLPQTFPSTQAEFHQMDDFNETELYEDNSMQKPCFKKKLISRRQKILGSVHFKCLVVPVGDPHMRVIWLLDGKPLECANRIKEKLEFGHASLHISAVYPRDTGVITCRASNKHGQAQTSCTLIVKEEKGLVNATQLCDSVMLERIQDTEKHRQEMSLIHDSHLDEQQVAPSAPKIVLPLEPVRVQEGDAAKFQCRIIGHPAPKVSWHLNEQRIVPCKRFRIWQDGIHYFEISATRNYDNGHVKLVAENELGRDEASARIEVYRSHDMRSVLHKGSAQRDGRAFKQHKMARNLEEKYQDSKGKQMVQLKEVEKPSRVSKQLKTIDRVGELQRKFSRLSEEDRMLKTYEANTKKTKVRDREYEARIRKAKNELTRSDKSPEAEVTQQERKATNHATGKVARVKGRAPVVEIHLKNLTLTPGQDATFRIQFQSEEEEITILWFRNQVQLEKTERVEFLRPENGVGELRIHQVMEEDSGPISVQIANSAGRVGSHCFLSVRDTSNPLRFEEPLSDISARENDKSAIFECRLSHVGPAVAWCYQEEDDGAQIELDSTDKHQALREGSQQYLRICDIKLSDAGVYSCRVSDGEVEAETSARLKVAALSKSVLSNLSDQVVNERSSGRFVATVSHAEVDGAWLKDGQEIQKGDKYEIESSGSERTLIVKNCRVDDEGIYEFQYGDKKTKATLTVEAMNVKIIKKLQRHQVYVGEPATFEVKLSRADAIGVWRKNGIDITNSDRVAIQSDLSKHSLIVLSCSQEDAGSYSFTAADATTEAALVVQDVTVVEPLRDVIALETTDAKFTCRVDRSDYKSGKWFCDGKEIKSDRVKRAIETSGFHQQLTVKGVSEDLDGGRVAYVTGSHSATEAELRVTPVEITRPLCDVMTYESSFAKMEVHLSHEGAKGAWYFNGKQLKSTSKRHIEAVGAAHMLTITSVSIEDAGAYEFRTSRATCTGKLSVKEIQFTQQLANQRAFETAEVCLSCEASSDNLVGKWFRGEQEIDEDAEPRYRYIRDGRIHQLFISDVRASDGGKFSFQIGRSTTSAVLDAIAIKLSKGLRNITVSEGADALFLVEVVNEEVKNVRWEKNGVQLVENDPKYDVELAGKTFTLTINSVTKRDEAAYSCVAGSTKTTARLFVEDSKRKRMDTRASSKLQPSKTTEPNNDTAPTNTASEPNSLSNTSETSQNENTNQNDSVPDENALLLSSSTSGEESNVIEADAQCDVADQLVVEAVVNSLVVPELGSAVLEFKVNKSEVKGTWYREEKVIDVDKQTRFRYEVDNLVHRLCFDDVSLSEAGQFAFQVGNTRATTDLQVQETVMPVRDSPQSLPPSIKIPLEDFITREGNRAHFSCQISGKGIEGEWKRNGNPLEETPYNRIFHSDDVYKLEIPNVCPEDEGEYQFTARNDLGEVSCSASLKFGSIEPPVIRQHLQNDHVIEGSAVRMDCNVEGLQLDVSWYVNNRNITEDERYKCKLDKRTGTCSLVIPDCTDDDSGEIRCRVSNAAGEAHSSANLRVSGSKRSKKERKAPDINFDVSTLHNETDHLHVRSTMTGKEFTIRRSDVNRLVGNYISQSDVDPTLADTPILSRRTTVLSDLDDDLVAPAFIQKPKLQSVSSDENALFRCSFVASPSPTITWSHNDIEIKGSNDRYVIRKERDMMSYQVSLKVKCCREEDTGVYRIALKNKKGSAFASATLAVVENDSPRTRPTDDVDGSPGRKYNEIAEKLKAYLSESDLHQACQEATLRRLRGPDECCSAPGSGTVTPRRPFSPRLYYKRRNPDVKSSLDTGSNENLPLSGRESRASRMTECFEQSFSSISSLSSLSNVSPTRLTHSFDSEERPSRYNTRSPNAADALSRSPTDVLSRSLTITDQRKLNSIKTNAADSGLGSGLFKAKSARPFSDTESTMSKSFDEQSFAAASEHFADSIDLSQSDKHRRYFSRAAQRIPPQMVSALPDAVHLREGDELRLRCDVDGFPRPKVLWMRDAEPLSDKPDYTLEQIDRADAGETGFRHTLSLARASAEHAGTYTLTAYNRHGESSTETRVCVKSLESDQDK